MHIAKHFLRKKLEEHDESPKYTCFEKKYGQNIPLYVYFFTNNIMCM